MCPSSTDDEVERGDRAAGRVHTVFLELVVAPETQDVLLDPCKKAADFVAPFPLAVRYLVR